MNALSTSGWPYLGLVLLIPVGWYWARRRRLRLPFAFAARAPQGMSPLGRLWWVWPTLWRSLALLLMVLALLRPERMFRHVEKEREGVAIMLAVDISSSMLAEDFRPENRIAVAKREVIRFIENRPSDWIGLVAFSGEALTMVPGTLDHELVKGAVESLTAGQLRDGTAIGTALATAANRLRELAPESRIVVLLTDGDNNSGTILPEDAAAAAAALGIRVYTIGIGRDGVAPVPVARTAFGYQYANVRVHVNDELLDSIARATGGVYFRATEPEALTQIYTRIDELEKAPLREVRTIETVALRPELLLLAFAALCLELLGSATRARRVLAA
ncbi:MAG: VWA domain-containing protein [Gemmatimonadota bacterium]